MIRVEGPEPGALPARTHHHGQAWLGLIHALALALLFESELARDAREHVLRQSRPGANSFSLVTESGREYHFRGRDPGTVEVLDRYRDGQVIARFSTTEEARQFMIEAGRVETSD